MESKTVTNDPPTARALVVGPAAITLAVTLARLGLEFAGAPAWLGNAGLGGVGAIVGIAWLPLLFGPWFHARLRAAAAPGQPTWKALTGTLLLYGLLARLPVFLLTIPALYLEWGTHYEKFPFEGSNAAKVGATALAQFGVWACIWTVGVGLLAAFVVHKLRGTPEAPAMT